MTTRPAAAAVFLLAALPLATAAPAASADAGPAPPGLIESGKQIFQGGTSPSGGEILAVLSGGTELPAASLPCSSCHGEDGTGNPEGGVSPSNLTWPALTRPYDVETERGREHGPYDARSLRRAIATGIDPAGNELHLSMPRYQMSREDMDALVAYIRQLGEDRAPGVDDDSLRVGTLLPPPGRMDGVGEAIEAVLEAWADTVNEGGGLYGRSVELATLRLPSDPAGPDEIGAAVAEFLAGERAGGEEGGVFALVGAFIAGSEDTIPALLNEHRVPSIGPFTLHPTREEPVNPWVFYLLPGLRSQGRALVRFAHERLKEATEGEEVGNGTLPVGTVLHPEKNPALETVAAAMLEEARTVGWSTFETRTYVPGAIDALGLASALATIDSRAVFFLGSGEDRQLLVQGADHFNWLPEVYIPGSMAGPRALATPGRFDGRVFLSFPTLPQDRSPEAAGAYAALAEDHDLPRRHLATQLSTLAAAHVFAEGVKRAGRRLTRSKLVDALEQLYKWDSGLTPPLSFDPNRRIGARGAYIVRLDLEEKTFERVGGWVEVR